MRWRRITLWSGVGLLALVAVAISWLLLADLGSFKPQIERWASAQTGRTVAINGALQIDLARHSSVVAHDVHISNAAWAEPPEMVAVGRLELRLDLLSILSGSIVIELIDLDDATIFLIEAEQGESNWALFDTSADLADANKDRKALDLLIQQIDIDRVRLSYDSPNRAAPVEVWIEQISQRHREDDLLDLSLDGTLNGRPMQLDGEVGTWAALLQRKDVQFDLDARLDTFTLSADGRIDDLLSPRRPAVNFTAKAPDVNDLLRALGVARQGQGVIDLAGTLAPEHQGQLVLAVAGDFGRLNIEASGAATDLRDLDEVKFDLLASGDDVAPILEAFGFPQSMPAPFMINVDAERHGKVFIIEEADMVFGQAKFTLAAKLPDFPSVDDSVIRLQVHGPDIERFRDIFNLPGAATGAFSAELTVDVAEDGFELVKLKSTSSIGVLRADGKLGDAPKFFGTTLDFQLNSQSLAKVASAYGIANLPDEPLQLSGSAEYGEQGISSIEPLTLTVNDVSIEIDGNIKTVQGLFGSDLDFELQGPDLAAQISAFTTVRGVPAQAYRLGGQLQIRDDGYRFRNVSGKLGSSDVELDGLLVPLSGVVGSRFKVTAQGAAFTELTDQLGEFNVRPGPYELSGGISILADRITLEAVELNRATANMNLDLALGIPLSRRWMNLDVRASGPNVQSVMQGIGAFVADEAPFRVEVKVGQREARWSVDKLDINVGVANLTGQGTIDLGDDSSSTRFDLNVNIPNVGALGMFAGERMLQQSFTMNASVTGSGDGLQVDDLLATLGDSDIHGEMQLRRGEVPQLDIQVQSNSIELAALLEEHEPEHEPAPALDDGLLIPDLELPFAAMARLNATLEIDVGELKRGALKLRDVVLRAALQDGALLVSDARFQAKSGALAARGSLAPNGGEGSASLELVARQLALGMRELNQDTAMQGDVDINLKSTGNDLRALLGNANGVLFLNARGGRFGNNRFLQTLYGNTLDEIVGTINPFSKSEKQTTIECVIMPLEISSGILTAAPASLIATDKMQIVMESRLNLASEALDINVRTTPKKGISISAGEIINPYIKVVGTLASPRLAVDETGVLLSGSAAVATGGLSILARAAWSRMSRAKDPCKDLTEKSLELLDGRFSDLDNPIVAAQPQTQPETVE